MWRELAVRRFRQCPPALKARATAATPKDSDIHLAPFRYNGIVAIRLAAPSAFRLPPSTFRLPPSAFRLYNTCVPTHQPIAAMKALAGIVKIHAQTVLPATPHRTADTLRV